VIQDEVCTVALKEQGLFLSIRKSMRWRQNLKSVLEARLYNLLQGLYDLVQGLPLNAP
jgi:hypothetical protein